MRWEEMRGVAEGRVGGEEVMRVYGRFFGRARDIWWRGLKWDCSRIGCLGSGGEGGH